MYVKNTSIIQRKQIQACEKSQTPMQWPTVYIGFVDFLTFCPKSGFHWSETILNF